MSYAIKVIDEENDEEGFVCDGMSDTPTRYRSKKEAKEFADFMRIGMDETIIVVPYPEQSRASRENQGAEQQQIVECKRGGNERK